MQTYVNFTCFILPLSHYDITIIKFLSNKTTSDDFIFGILSGIGMTMLSP